MNIPTPTTTNSNKTIAIDVAEASGYAICVASGDGEKLYERIAAAFNAGQKVMLDFQNVTETSPAFMGAAIAQLYKNFPAAIVADSLSFSNANAEAEADIEDAVYWTKEYLKDPQRFIDSTRKVFGDDYV